MEVGEEATVEEKLGQSQVDHPFQVAELRLDGTIDQGEVLVLQSVEHPLHMHTHIHTHSVSNIIILKEDNPCL